MGSGRDANGCHLIALTIGQKRVKLYLKQLVNGQAVVYGRHFNISHYLARQVLNSYP
jgi:hypothetical protein